MDAATASRIFEPFFTTKGDDGDRARPRRQCTASSPRAAARLSSTPLPEAASTFSVYLPLCAEALSSASSAAARS